MSYDIRFLAVPEGHTLADVAERALDHDRDEPRQIRLELWDRIEAEFRDLVGPDVESGAGSDSAEASDITTGLTVSLFPAEASVTFPYWGHEDEQAFARQVDAVVAMVERITGWQAYDPQVGGAYVGIDEESTERAARLREGILSKPSPAGPGLTRADLLPDNRRRYLTYLISGAVCLVGGGVLLAREPFRAAELIALGLGANNARVAWGIRRRMHAQPS